MSSRSLDSKDTKIDYIDRLRNAKKASKDAAVRSRVRLNSLMINIIHMTFVGAPFVAARRIYCCLTFFAITLVFTFSIELVLCGTDKHRLLSL